MNDHTQEHVELVALYVLRALPADEVPAAEARFATCADCRDDLDKLQPLIGAFVSWPTDVLRPSSPLWDRLAQRIAAETGKPPVPAAAPRPEPTWLEAGPGISYKLLSTDLERRRVSMLVRLAPGANYPPHCHSGVEELHLLDGELVVDQRTLLPGDYIHAETGSEDHVVWSGTGCTCVLITSIDDVIL